jgi:hypothetical protein
MKEVKEPIMPGLKLNMGNWSSRLLELGNRIFRIINE